MTEEAQTASGRIRSHRFSNRFGNLDPYVRAEEFLETLGGVAVEQDSLAGPMLGDQESETVADVDAGIAFFGQFIDHEITFDPTSSLERRNDPQALRNFRTPTLDLDSVYGGGEEVRPFLYDHDDPDTAKLLTGPASDADPTDEDAPRAARFGASDLQRNRQGRALITDPRNDENVVIAQLQLSFIKFHNRVVDYLRSGDGHELLETSSDEHAYEAARRLVRWHYQWLVLHEFLPRICDGSVLDDIRANGRSYFLQPDTPTSIPVEFAGAAYRYGHSQIRDRYTVNDDTTDVQFFPGPAPEQVPTIMRMMLTANGDDGDTPAPSDGIVEEGTSQNLNGFRPVPEGLTIEWGYFFDHHPGDGEQSTAQRGRPIDCALPPALLRLPFISEGPKSLAVRNLLRGQALGLPSGQALAATMDIDPLSNGELRLPGGESFADYLSSVHRGADTEAPLWLYVLAEAAQQQGGDRLGALGSRIVGEVITGMVAADPRAFVTEEPEWTPTLPRPISESRGEDGTPYRFADLLQFATGPAPDGLEITTIDGDGSGTAPDTPADDRTNGEAIIVEHTGGGPLLLDGYTVDYEEQTETITAEEPLSPGERAVIYTGDGPAAPEDSDERILTLGRGVAAIDDAGDTVVIRTPAGEVSAYREY
jgi:hypothetical protein